MSKLIGIYRNEFPVTLYRFQSAKEIKLREMISQLKKNKSSYDFTLFNGLIKPIELVNFERPNGMSLRPMGSNLKKIAKTYKYNYAYEILKGTKIPEELNLILVHEHTDHYSLQTSVECTEEDLNLRLNKFIESSKLMTKEEMLKLI